MARGVWAVSMWVALTTFAMPTFAAREFTPQAGMWTIPTENDGKPGRGFSLDVQGNTAFLQVFNYEKNGDATFHTAVGKLDAAASMTVPLQRFKGGQAFGGTARDAVPDGSPGNITVHFDSGLSGSVQFPGEEAQPIARFIVDQKMPPWWTQLASSPPSGYEGFQEMHWTVTSQRQLTALWKAVLSKPVGGDFSLVLTSESKGLNGAPQDKQTLSCQLNESTRVFDCAVTAAGGSALKVDRLRFRLLGPDVVGEIQPQGDAAQRLTINGWDEGSFSCLQEQRCTRAEERSARIYMYNDHLSQVCFFADCSGYSHLTVVPSSGAWIIDDENTGKPGRGVFLDAQDNTLIVQTSDYLVTGEPSFHMGVSTLKSSFNRAEDTTTGMSLLRYADGRYFGGPAQSGREVAEAGSTRMTFPAPTFTKEKGEIVRGTVTLPGEATKAMRRLQLEGPSAGIEHMLGEYFIRWSGTAPEIVRLVRMEGRFALSADGRVQCFQPIQREDPYKMTCAYLLATDRFDNWLASASIQVGPFPRVAVPSYGDFSRRTRDQHGNWLGLGVVNLPGLAIPVLK